jgi:hypothetical protein
MSDSMLTPERRAALRPLTPAQVDELRRALASDDEAFAGGVASALVRGLLDALEAAERDEHTAVIEANRLRCVIGGRDDRIADLEAQVTHVEGQRDTAHTNWNAQVQGLYAEKADLEARLREAKREVEIRTATIGLINRDLSHEREMAGKLGNRALAAEAERDAARAEVAATKEKLTAMYRSFEGHVYVKNEEYAALCDEKRTAHADALAARGEVERLREALAFYADPDSYFAISMFSDPPCGEFAEDYSEAERESDGCVKFYPGKRARDALASRPALHEGGCT